ALAGQQIDIVCARRCRLTQPRLWQPDEPWTTPPGYHASLLPRVVRGRRPAASALVPARAPVVVHDLRAAGEAPEQLAVLWERYGRTGAGRGTGPAGQAQGRT